MDLKSLPKLLGTQLQKPKKWICILVFCQVPLFLLFFCKAPDAFCYPMSWQLAQPTDGSYGMAQSNASGPIFLVNPAAFSGENFSLGIAEVTQNREIKLVNNSTNNTVTTSTKQKVTAHAIEIAQQLGAGFLLGITVSQTQEDTRSKNDNSRYNHLPLEETLLSREASPKFSLEFSKNFKLGAAFRYVHFKANSYGTFFIDPQYPTTFKGNLFGVNIGAQMSFDTGGFGLCYLTPMRGKSTIDAESKLTTTPGLVFVNAFWSPHNSVVMGVMFAKHQHEKNELSEPVPGPAGSNVREIQPLGVSPDSRFLLLQSIGGSIKIVSTSGIGLELTPIYQTGAHEVSNVGTPEIVEDKDKQSNFYQTQGSIFLSKKEFFLAIATSYFNRKKSIEETNGNKRQYETKELSLIANVALTL